MFVFKSAKLTWLSDMQELEGVRGKLSFFNISVKTLNN